MRVVFLDIDGVVLPNRANWLPTQTKPVLKVFDPCAVSLLNKACHVRKLKIVIHSSWLRYWLPSDGADTVKDWCVGQGIKKGHFHDDAECNKDIHWRYDRIRDWLSRHKVTRFLILDDDLPDDGDTLANHLIACNSDEGIGMEVYNKMLIHPLK